MASTHDRASSSVATSEARHALSASAAAAAAGSGHAAPRTAALTAATKAA
jgi:hypothetical protein